jgi:TIR domain
MAESPRDLFISHSSSDADAARELRSILEVAGYTCWMAPDDVTATTPWAAQILQAIETSRAMLVLVSSRSNQSTHVSREVELAASRGRAVFPIRVEDVPPSGALEYHIAGLQRIDAFPPPIAGHREQILRRLAVAVPLAGPAPSPAPLPSPDLAPGSGNRSAPPSRGLGAWARANAMLAGAGVTLVALFLVAAVGLALNRPGASAGASPLATIAAVASAGASGARLTGTPASPAAGESPSDSGGPFPSSAEQRLFDSIPDFGKTVIADCARDTSGSGTPIAAIKCDADNGELLFYELYADLATQQREYLDWVRAVMGSPIGSCATSDAGDAPWPSAGPPRGHLACYLPNSGAADFYWTDEQRLITVYWYGTPGVAPGTTHSIGYQLFLDWTGEQAD